MAEVKELKDSYGRRLNYLRISVTDRCNYRCLYCMPSEGVECISHADILRYEDIKFLCRVFRGLGVEKFRFTGGEPLVRRGIVPFLKELREEMPDAKIALTTNASLLANFARGLAGALIDHLNVSLDTVDAQKFAQVTRLGRIEDVFAGIAAAKAEGIDNIKLNAVLIRGFNDTEVPAMLAYARREGLLLRLIEFMPLQESIWKKDAFIIGRDLLKTLPDGAAWEKSEGDGGSSSGPAEYYVNRKTGDRIGIITAVSNHFCKSCNRLRISAEGKLRTCLFNPKEIPLKELIQQRRENDLREAILAAAAAKPRCWDDVKNGNMKMSGIGG